ncbi:MAG: YbdD/YjiX family protein [Nitrosomonadales bacterium]|jgi:uncharacterized short protein YbdD (DUF466 family)|nr:YbdD/YjiX family protein [Nitrosomonadales bacterium]
MSTGLIERGVGESFSVVSDSSLPAFETGRDLNQYVAQSGTLTANEEVCVKPFQLLSYVWRVIRELSGDDAYERYIAQHTTSSPGITPLTRKDFYLYQQRKKWSGIQRCC